MIFLLKVFTLAMKNARLRFAFSINFSSSFQYYGIRFVLNVVCAANRFTSFNYVIILSYNDIGSVCTFYGIFSNYSWYILDRLCLLCWPLLNLARDFSHFTWNRTTLSCAALIIHYNKYKRKLSNDMITLELVFFLVKYGNFFRFLELRTGLPINRTHLF